MLVRKIGGISSSAWPSSDRRPPYLASDRYCEEHDLRIFTKLVLFRRVGAMRAGIWSCIAI